MLKIDSHQHFWNYDPVKDGWITEDMAVLKHDFLPGDLAPVLTTYNFDGCVAVQASQSEKESDFLLSLAKDNSFIKGVVGWVDLAADDIEERLAHYSRFKPMKGFRHVLQGETDRAYMHNASFKRGIAALKKYNFTYDILIHDDQLPYIPGFVSAFPGQPFVIDHLAKPQIKLKEIKEWEKNIREVAVHPQVYCKISGFVTEADWANWKINDFEPYFDVIFNAFGPQRLMFGSDWPVCKLAATYGQLIEILKAYTVTLSDAEQACFWGANAAEFYQL